MSSTIDTVERTCDYFLRIMILVVTLVSLVRWASESGTDISQAMTFAVFALAVVIALITLGAISFIKARRK